MSAMASQITSLTTVYSTVYSGADQRKHQSSASLAFVRGIHRSPVNSPHKGTVTRKMFPFDNVIIKVPHIGSFWAPSQYRDRFSWYMDSHCIDEVVIISSYFIMGILILVRQRFYIEKFHSLTLKNVHISLCAAPITWQYTLCLLITVEGQLLFVWKIQFYISQHLSWFLKQLLQSCTNKSFAQFPRYYCFHTTRKNDQCWLWAFYVVI